MPKMISLAVVAALGLLPLSVPLAAAAPEQPRYAPTMLVLDASGSMLADDPAGGTKMDAAKTAVRSFVDAAPADARVGLSVYGTGTGSTDAEQAAGCRDVSVLHPAETVDRAALTTAVEQIVPRGFTPIGAALRTAAGALPAAGPRSIVLVSDGLDTCAPPDPCEVARELSADGAEIVMHAIGFGVDDASRAQLTCIAEATGGTYTDAADGKALERILPRVSAAALRDYAAEGERVEGTSGYQDAPVLSPGQYLDAVGQKSPRHYAVDIPEGATAYFSGTVAFPRDDTAGDNNAVRLRVYGADGQDCNGFEHESAPGSAEGVALTVTSRWEGAALPKTGSPGGDKCRGGGRYYFTVEWGAVAEGAPASLPLELNVAIEQGVGDAGIAPDPAPVDFVAPSGPDTPVTGGGSFNVATALPCSGRYTDTLQRGEFVFYKVRVGWGRGLAYRVRFLATPARGLENISVVDTTLYSPSRKEIDNDFGSYYGETHLLPANAPAVATPAVRYRNRESRDTDVAAAAVAGWYYLAVKVGPAHTDSPDARPVPIELEVAVTGSPEPGPTYLGADQDADPPAYAVEPDCTDGFSSLVYAGFALVVVLGTVGAVLVVWRVRRRR